MAENGEFISCSYPGLATHEALKQAVVDDIDRFGVQTSVAITRKQFLVIFLIS
jgi:7-keto-8-aminopelargonate synthetase-like enzyme